MLARVRSPRRLEGEIRVPGDKSISHRALLLGAVSQGEAHLGNLSDGADVASTARCLGALGVEVEDGRVAGRGLRGLREPAGALDCGNSGTTMRLLAGLLAGQGFAATLVGDESLSRRPMERVTAPLRLMGARAELGPLRVGGGGALRAISYDMPVASAQVKSAVLLAGMYARGTTSVVEPARTRDHTERMLAAMGAPVAVTHGGLAVAIEGPLERLRSLDLTVPGDLSAAAFWLVAGGLHPAARLRLPAVDVNPTRTAVLELLACIGVQVARLAPRLEGAEPVADLEVGTAASPRPFAVSGGLVAALIDELPVLVVAAAVLPGTTRVVGAGELRVKESDRIAAMTAGLRAMGADVTELPDGWEVRGPRRLEGARVDSRGDHRVAMALAVAGLLAGGETEIEGAESAGVSYAGFWEHLEALGA